MCGNEWMFIKDETCQITSSDASLYQGCNPISTFCQVILVEIISNLHKRLENNETCHILQHLQLKKLKNLLTKISTLSNLYPNSLLKTSTHNHTTLPPKQEETSELKVLPGCFCRFVSSNHQSSAQQLHSCFALI